MNKIIKNILLISGLYILSLIIILIIFYVTGMYVWTTPPTKLVLMRIIFFSIILATISLIIIKVVLKRKCSVKLAILLVLLLFFSVLGNSYLYNELNKVKGIMPSLNNDYFTRQVGLTYYFKEREIEDRKWLEDKKMVYDEYASKKYDYFGDKSMILNVNLIGQNPNYPNGCEAASATMLLNFYGIDISLEDFINKYLPKEEVYEKNGSRYGPDPSKYYAGDPSSDTGGWGCFEPVIEKTINKILYQTDYVALDLTNNKISDLIYSYPVAIWVTTDYSEATEVYNWTDESENVTYTYPTKSHTVLLIGADNEYYYINDPLKPESVQKVLKETLEKSYDSLGRQAVAIELQPLLQYEKEYKEKLGFYDDKYYKE